MGRKHWGAGLALGLGLLSTNAPAGDVAAVGFRADAVLYRAHVTFGVGSLADVGPRDACGQPQVAAGQDEMDQDAWVDPARQVHGSGLIANCTITPAPDERERTGRSLPPAVRS